MTLKISMLAGATAFLAPLAAVAQAPDPHVAGPGATVQSQTDTKAKAKAEVKADANANADASADAKANPDVSADTKADTNGSAGSTEAAAIGEADVKAGASIFDPQGNVVGKVESVSAEGAVVNTGKVQAQIPFSSLSRNDKGLVIAMTATEFEAAANAKKQ